MFRGKASVLENFMCDSFLEFFVVFGGFFAFEPFSDF